jgi:hypothetical protein
MFRQPIEPRNVILHVGPHKTGSTAIQKWLQSNPEFLSRNGVTFLHNSQTHKSAQLIAREHYTEAELALLEVSKQISSQPSHTVLLSQEDFSGDLPGRTRKKGIYSRLLRNLRTIRRALSPHSVTFVFFQRDATSWLRSCYHQYLVYRTQFHTFDEYQDSLGGGPDWANILARANQELDQALVVLNYSSEPDAGVRELLNVAGITDPSLPSIPTLINQSPSEAQIKALEGINERSSFPKSAWFSKQLILRGWSPKRAVESDPRPKAETGAIGALALPGLFERAKSRISPQESVDLLPDELCDLGGFLTRRLPEAVPEPSTSRHNMVDQSAILDYHFRGHSELSKLNALVISYLRRDTAHTEKAKRLFHRVWNEYGAHIVNELSTRWLISTMQTFLDHGVNEHQRLVGGCGYFYANMMKIYEGERAIEGLEQDAILSGSEPTTRSHFRGLDRYKIGGSDLLLNTNALALELSLRDEVAGLVLQEFMLRVKNSGNVFTRSDATRAVLRINVPGFEDTWAFFQDPSKG